MVRNVLFGLVILAQAMTGAGLKCRGDPSKCPGYKAENVAKTDSGITADLNLAGAACNAYSRDLKNLKLLIEYETKDRLHVKISDAGNNVYQVHESIFTRPKSNKVSAADSNLKIDMVENPFSFVVSRKDSGEVLFNTTGSQLIMETQYVRLRTSLPQDPNLYGLGEHSDSFRLPTKGYKRTMWNAESPFIPRKSNLYGSHPVYFEHRGKGGTHGVFLLNANGMDIKIDQDAAGQFLEYNTIGGIVDLYFLAGPTPNDVSKQYAEVAGLPVMQQYWTFGYHQCKFGWKNIETYNAVVQNYSDAGIPLETLWGDIDYMDGRADFTLDPVNFPLPKYRQLVDRLHSHDQHMVMMVDPAIPQRTTYEPYVRGKKVDAFLKADDGSDYYGAQWAGTSVWPDWFAPNTSEWWQSEIMRFFDADKGVNVDGLWNDMNEVSNFCHEDKCPVHQVRNPKNKPKEGAALGLQEYRNLVYPAYKIGNHRGNLSHQALSTNVTNYDGSVQYDTHSLYGNGMVASTRGALLKRRPGVRPFVLTRASYAGMGTHGAHWFGDNNSTWSDYRIQIAQMMAFASIHQVSMVGSDVCGFNGVADEKMCSRWAMLGALSPFYRNHADQSAPPQEFYRWPLVAQTAKKAIDMRYRLIDYLYTHMQRQTETGEPAVKPLFYLYPEDSNTFPIDLQYFFGDSLLVSPVTGDYSQDVTFYLPDDVFYDFWTGDRVEGAGKAVTRTGVAWDDIPLHVRGGSIIATRAQSANTTAALRTKNFSLLVAPGRDGKASGSLYLDDGKSIDVGDAFSRIDFTWDGGVLRSSGKFGYKTDVRIESVVFMGGGAKQGTKASVMDDKGAAAAQGSWPLTEAVEIKV